MSTSYLWTKDKIAKVIQLWEVKTITAIADEIGAPRKSINYMITLLRKNGVPLTKKWKKGETNSLIKEMISDGSIAAKR